MYCILRKSEVAGTPVTVEVINFPAITANSVIKNYYFFIFIIIY